MPSTQLELPHKNSIATKAAEIIAELGEKIFCSFVAV
jgi:hypothetical protein